MCITLTLTIEFDEKGDHGYNSVIQSIWKTDESVGGLGIPDHL